MYEDIDLEQAWRLLQEHSPSLRHEVVSATAALGRILAQTLYAGQDLPPQAQSAVDGYALGENHGMAVSYTHLDVYKRQVCAVRIEKIPEVAHA